MNNGIAIGLALICLLLLIVVFKWTLSQLNFLLALIAGLNQNSDNQWKAIHQLQERPRLPASEGPESSKEGAI